MFRESPPDGNHNETLPFTFSFPYSNVVPTWHRYIVSCEIPAGFTWEGWTLRKGKQLIEPDRVDYDSLQRLLRVEYPSGAEAFFSGTELQILLRGDCEEKGVVSGMREMVLSICRKQEQATARVAEACLLTDERIPVTLQCEETMCQGGGMIFTNFGLERTNLGIGEAKRTIEGFDTHIRKQRLMYGDTLRGFFQGIVAEVDSPLFWQFGFASSRIEHGEYLEPISSQLKIYDYSSGRYLYCNDIVVSSYMDLPNRMFFYDISPETLAKTSSSFANYLFEGKDSVWLETIYRVNENLGDSLLRATVENRFYLSDVPNPTLRSQVHQCGSHDAAFTLVGYDFTLGSPQQIDVSYPVQEISQSYQFKIGGSDIFSGHDAFPYEHRYFGHIKQAQIILPRYYEYHSMMLEQGESRYPLFPSQIDKVFERDTTWFCSSDTLVLNLEESLAQSRGASLQADGEFQGHIKLHLIPQCEALYHPAEKIKWAFTYAHSGWLNGGKESRWYRKQPDTIRYRRPQLQGHAYEPACNPASKLISWTLELNNPQPSSMAFHSWLFVDLPEVDSRTEILALIDLSTGDTLQSYQELFRLNMLQANEDFLYEILIQYQEIPPEFITVYSGFGCNAYPEDFTLIQDEYLGLNLYLDPLLLDIDNTCDVDESSLPHAASKID